VDIGAAILGFVAAVVLVAGGALILDAWLRVAADRAERARRAEARFTPRPPTSDDATQFRIGLIGGTSPPRAMEPRQGRQIAEMLSYVDAGPDLRRYDIGATIARHARQPELEGMVSARRRVLPEVLMLVDTASGGPVWNTLAADAEAQFTQRGLFVTTVPFEGTLHRGVMAASGVADDASAAAARAIGLRPVQAFATVLAWEFALR
jgi:hypothetical protein